MTAQMTVPLSAVSEMEPAPALFFALTNIYKPIAVLFQRGSRS
jgi:hypothetical protein